MSPARTPLRNPGAGFPRVSGDEPEAHGGSVVQAGCFPRVSGDEPQRLNLAAWDITFSPRERG